MDVFKNGFVLPSPVCIVGSGPSAPGDEDKIPAGCYLLAVNQGVERVDADIWMCMDVTLPQKPWWEAAYNKYAKREGKPITLFGEMLAEKYPSDYTFANGRAANFDNYIPKENELRIGMTIAGQAFQLCGHLGVAHVYIFGITMRGNQYYTSETNPLHVADEDWNCINRFGGLIEYFRGKGMRVEFLTESALNKEEASGTDTS